MCAKGFEAVEFDNLDSWTRFDGTPLADAVPFGRRAAVAYAELLTDHAHRRGLAVAQKNTLELGRRAARRRVGFDFVIAEQCGRHRECRAYTAMFGDRVIVIEYGRRGFRAACVAVGQQVSVVRRDIAVSTPGSGTYRYRVLSRAEPRDLVTDVTSAGYSAPPWGRSGAFGPINEMRSNAMKRTSFLRSALGITAVVVTATAVIHAPAGAKPQQPSQPGGEFVVAFADGNEGAARAAIRRAGGTIVDVNEAANLALVSASGTAARKIRTRGCGRCRRPQPCGRNHPAGNAPPVRPGASDGTHARQIRRQPSRT